MSSGLTSELRFIAACIRRAVAPRAEAHAGALGREPDWGRVADIALRQRVVGVVWSGIGRPPTGAGSEDLGRLRVANLAAVVHHEVVVEPMVRDVLECLHEAGIDPIVLKGAALAYTAYPAPVQRTFADLDLLLTGPELGPAALALRERGFAADPRGPGASHHLAPYRVPGRPLGVELHIALVRHPHPFRVELDRVREAARAGVVAGVAARILSPEDALFLACVHVAYAHGYWAWFPLRALADVLAITAGGGPGLDWERFVAAAKSSRASGAVYWPLRLGRDWLGAPVPAPVLARLSPPTVPRRLVECATDPGYVIGGRARRGLGRLFHAIWQSALYQDCSARIRFKATLGYIVGPMRRRTR